MSGIYEFINQNKLWYDRESVPKESLPATLQALVEKLDQQVSMREERNLLNLRMYSNAAIRGLSADSYSDIGLLSPRLAWNIIQSCVDTAAAHIATQRPKPKFITSGGLHKDRQKAEDLTNFVSGQFYQTRTYEVTKAAFKDAAIFGTGFVKIFEDNDTVCLERVFPNEIIVDDVDSKYGNPRNIYHHKEVPIDVLAELYPEHKEALMEAQPFRNSSSLRIGTQDVIGVLEAWHLGAGGTPGRHTMCTTNATLVDAEWTRDRFPFAILRWNTLPLGFWGQGIAEMVEGIQYEVNSVLLKIQRLVRLATSKVFVQKGTKINKASLNNEDWGVIEYAGDRPPDWKVIQAFSPDYASYLESLYNRAFELVGISQLAAQSKKPEGLNSGKAIREYSDIQTKRFMEVGQGWEQLHLDIAEQMIGLAKDIDERGDNPYGVMADVGDQLKELKWKDVNLDKDSYIMKAWPVPVLTGSPAFQLQTIIDVGQMNPNLQAALLPQLEHPDVKAFMDRENADYNLADKITSAMLEDKEYPPPEPMMNLGLMLDLIRKYYIEFTIQGEDEEVLQKFRDWLAQAQQLMMPPTPPLPEVPQAPVGGPGLAEGPPTAAGSINPALSEMTLPTGQ